MRLRPHLVLLLALILAAQAADEPRLSIYTPQTSFSIAVLDRDGAAYVNLLDLLNPLGATAARQDGDKYKVTFAGGESQFEPGKKKAKLRGKNTDLGAPFLLDTGKPLIPLHAVAAVLTRVQSLAVDFRESARRLFLGGAATQFAADLEKGAPSRLVLHFSAPVNPAIATEPGHLRMTFVREPIVAPAPSQSFDDPLIKSVSFSEHNGAAELTIAAGAPLLATFTDNGRTITIAPAPAASRARVPVPSPAPPPAPAAEPAPAAPPTAAPRPRFLVVIDPGHGGDDRGALLAANLVEKDVALAWARRLRAALEQRGVASTLLREADTTLSLDQRATLANAARPSVFVSLHVTTSGAGVHLYTSHLPESAQKAGTLLPWDSAQASFLDQSRAAAGSVAAELGKHDIAVSVAPVSLRPLDNVAAAAFALEVGPPAHDAAELTSAAYQQAICAALADGLAALRPSSPGGPH